MHYPQQVIDYKPINKYDPFLIPPNIKIAQDHAKAKQVGFVDFDRHNDYRQLCQCCNMPIAKDPIPLCVNESRLNVLGDGYPLFFMSIKMYVALLIVVCALVGVYNIVTTADSCYIDYQFSLFDSQDNISIGCYHFIGIAYTTEKSEEQLTIQAVLNLLGTFLMCGGLYWIKLKHTRINNLEYVPSDFTLLIKNIPIHYNSHDVGEFLGRFKHKGAIIKVINCMAVSDYLNNQRIKIDLLQEQRVVFARFQRPEQISKRELELKKMMRQIQVLDQKIATFEQEMSLEPANLRTSYILVVFNLESDVNAILEQCRSNMCCNQQDNSIYINDQLIEIRRAPEPLDLQWECLHISGSQKLLRRIMAIVVNLIVVCIGAIIIYGISYAQNSIQDQDFILKYLLSAVCALLLLVVNIVLEQLVKLTSKFECHTTYTHEIRSIVMTQMVMQFINTALVPFGLFAFTDFNHNNLMASLFFIFLGNVVILPLLELADPFLLYKIYLRSLIIKQGFRTQYTQQQANSIFEGPDYRIADKYSAINKSILMCAFYMTLFPYGSILQVISLLLYYWCCKYTLLRRCSWPSNLSTDLQATVYSLMTIMPILMAAGGMCYEFVLLHHNGNLVIHILNIVAACIGVVALEVVQRHNHYVDKAREVKTYNDVRATFKSDYDRVNPVTRTLAQQEWKQIWNMNV